MLGKELKDTYLLDERKDDAAVIAIGKDCWFHVHDDEEVPLSEYTIALLLRINDPSCTLELRQDG